MRTRVGIELSPAACRIVEIDAALRGASPPETRVRAFSILPRRGPETVAGLSALRGRQAAVIVWDAGADDRLERVTNAAAVREELQPIVAAGVRIRSVVTPPLALLSLARTRRALATPDATEAYVALDETASCAALVRNGALVASRDMGWGYLENWKGRPVPRPRLELAARLAGELTALFALTSATVGQVGICGGLSDLRSSTMPLMERLDVEVETLDSLFAIDAAQLPEPADDFRQHASALRLAWAVAADWKAPINLYREEQRRATRRVLVRAAAVGGVVAGLGAVWELRGRRPSPAPVALARAPGPSIPLARMDARVRPPSVDAPRTREARAATPITPPMPPLPKPDGPKTRVPKMAVQKTAVARTVAPKPDAPEPFDARLSTILYAADRRLAIVDGRIVQPGDEVRGARVIDITPTQVLLRDADGRSRELSPAGPSESGMAGLSMKRDR